MVTLEQLRNIYKPQILALAEKQGVTDVRVFGSVARGEQTEESDVDFLIHVPKGVDLMDVGGLHWRLEELLKTKVHFVMDSSISPYMKDNILNEAARL
ncbi:MAG: nucleotidyltransferase family protein [Pseudomonadota bacterium]